jgi:hypothetical protein
VSASRGAAFGEDGFGFFGGVTFPTLLGGEALVEGRIDRVAVVKKPVVFSFEKVEGVVDDVGGSGVGAAVELALDTLFGGGIEGQAHGGSIRLCGFRGKVVVRTRDAGRVDEGRLVASLRSAAARKPTLGAKYAPKMGHPDVGCPHRGSNRSFLWDFLFLSLNVGPQECHPEIDGRCVVRRLVKSVIFE